MTLRQRQRSPRGYGKLIPAIINSIGVAGDRSESQSDAWAAQAVDCVALPARQGRSMKLFRRRFLHLALGGVVLPVASRGAMAQTYPTRPSTMIVPYAAGGPVDTLTRFLAERMRAPLGQPVIVENVTGANGTIGVGSVARAAPDGYTLVAGIWGTHVVNGAIYPLQYDVLN